MFVEQLNREMNEKSPFSNRASKLGTLLSTNILLHYCEGRDTKSYDII